MIYGIGIDVVHVPRLKIAVERWGNKFLRRVFTDDEISYSFRKKDAYPSLAARFAAKEAFIKAIGAEVAVSFTDIIVTTSGTGKPSLIFRGRALIHVSDRNISSSHLSLSHDHEYAMAMVVLEQFPSR